MSGLVLLQFDPSKLTSPLVIEGIGDTAEPFPHLYGALNTEATGSARTRSSL